MSAPRRSGAGTPPSVVHVTEAMGAGVLQMLAELARGQAYVGWDVEVVYSDRAETPAPGVLRDLFGPRVRLVRAGGHDRRRNLLALAVAARAAMRARPAAVVHAHSTLAGLAVRAVTRRGDRWRVVYTPHGFAFLPLPARSLRQRGVLLAERVLAARGAGVLAVGPAEAAWVTRAVGPAVPVVSVPNTVSRAVVEHRSAGPGPGSRDASGRPLVLGVGRVTRQKAPWVFAAAARELASAADFVWVGDGDPQDRARWLPRDVPVEVTGWLNHHEVLDLLGRARLLLMPSEWEGMPVTLMEACWVGVPAVVRDAPGMADVVVDGVNGVVAQDDAAIVRETADVLQDEARWASLRDGCLATRDRFDPATYVSRVGRAYGALGVLGAQDVAAVHGRGRAL